MNEATFTVGPDDMAAANRLHFLKLFSARRWLFVFLGSAVALALLNFGLIGYIDPEIYLITLGTIWGTIVAICIVGWLMIPRQARRIWSQGQKLWIERRVAWDVDKIHFISANGEVHVSWGDYYRWAADERSLLLYQDDRSFHLLPLRNLPNGAGETMIGHLRAAGVQER